jgi:pimeloyl-ACP methyl ester carboxylesterase
MLSGGRRPFDETAARSLVRRDVERAHDVAAARNHDVLPDGELSQAPLSSIAVPTLVIHGTADATVPIEATGRAVAAQVPSADLIEYEGEPHGVFATQTQRLGEDIINFLGGGKIEGRQGMIDAMTADTIAMGVL